MKTILFIGASYAESFFIQKAKTLGYFIIAIDPNPEAIGLNYAHQKIIMSLTNKDACLAVAQINQIHGVFASTSPASILTAAFIAERLNLPGIKYQVAQTLTNDLQLRYTFFESFIDDLTKFHVINSLKDLLPLSNSLSFPVLLKYPFSYLQFGLRINNLSSLIDHVIKDSLQTKFDQILIEEYKEGDEYVIELFVYKGEAFILGILERNLQEDVEERAYTFPVKIANNPRVHALISEILNRLDINYGPASIELIITPTEEIFVLKVIPSISRDLLSSHVIPKALRYDYTSNLIKATVNDELELPPYRYSRNVFTRFCQINRFPDLSTERVSQLEKAHRVRVELSEERVLIMGVEDSLNFARNNVNAAVDDLTQQST